MSVESVEMVSCLGQIRQNVRFLSHRISETMQDRTEVPLITNRKSNIAYALSIGTEISDLG